MLRGLDHIAIIVRNTEDALKFYRDLLGFPVIGSEILQNPYVRTTYLDFGNTQLQLLEPLYESGALLDWLDARGEALHHICLKVDDLQPDVSALTEKGLSLRDLAPRIGGFGKPVQFLDPATTRGVLIELTTE